MKVFAISDLHLSSAVEKPMDIFGDGWQNHFQKIAEDWQRKVCNGDLVLLGGDISWGLTLEQAKPDYELIQSLCGRKFIVKGNHDYYWTSLNKMRTAFPDFDFIQNNSYRIPSDDSERGVIICGTRGWSIPDSSTSEADNKIYARERQRLELSLSDAESKRRDGDTVITMLHYPPFGADYSDTDLTRILENHNVNFVLYGHLHGKSARVTPVVDKRGIKYILTSCDLVDNKLIEITSL